MGLPTTAAGGGSLGTNQACGIYKVHGRAGHRRFAKASRCVPRTNMSRQVFERPSASGQGDAGDVAWPSIKPYRNSSTDARAVRLHVTMCGTERCIYPLQRIAKALANDSPVFWPFIVEFHGTSKSLAAGGQSHKSCNRHLPIPLLHVTSSLGRLQVATTTALDIHTSPLVSYQLSVRPFPTQESPQ